MLTALLALLSPAAVADPLLSSPELTLGSPLTEAPDLQVWVMDERATLVIDGEERFAVPLAAEASRPGPAGAVVTYDDALLLGSNLLIRRGVEERPDLSRSPARAVELYDVTGARVPVKDAALLGRLAAVDEQRVSPDGAWAVALVGDGGALERLSGVVVVDPSGELHPLRPEVQPLLGYGLGRFEGETFVLPVDEQVDLVIRSDGGAELRRGPNT